MPDYQNGKIYMLGLPPFLPYYSSTVQALKRRMSCHKKDARAYLKGTRIDRCTCNELVLRPGCKIELVEDFPCSSKQELERREGWYQLNNPCVNKIVAGRMPFIKELSAKFKTGQIGPLVPWDTSDFEE